MTMCMEAGPPLLDEMGRGSTKGQRNPTTSAVFILAASRYAHSNLLSFFFFRPFFFFFGYMPLFTAVETKLCFTWSASRVYGTLFKVASSPPPPDWLQEEKLLLFCCRLSCHTHCNHRLGLEFLPFLTLTVSKTILYNAWVLKHQLEPKWPNG